MNNCHKHIIWLPIILILLFHNKQIIKAQRQATTLRFGAYTTKINSSNKTDLDESLKQWVSGLQRNTKIEWLAKSSFISVLYESKSQLFSDIANRKIDFINLSTLDYFDLGLKDLVIPFITPARNLNNKFERFLLITNTKNEITATAQIKNAEIYFPTAYFLNLSKIWLTVELRNRINSSMIRTIPIVESQKTENELLHSVFFGNTRFAVVREGTYLIACELNSQLRNKIKILETSPNLINNFFGYRKDLDAESYTSIRAEALNLHKSVEGKQLLNIAKAECVHTLNASDLKETESLIKRYNNLNQ